MTDLGILLRGQSNAAIFEAHGAAEKLRAEVARDLGYDGVHDRVILFGDRQRSMWPGVPFVLGGPARPDQTPWLTGFPGPGWGIGARERIFLDYLAGLPAPLRHAPVLTLWMHNETDTYGFGLTAQNWAQAVRYDATLVRRVLGVTPAASPYLFVWVPANFPPENGYKPRVMQTAQAIKQGMALLAEDPGFNGHLGPQTGDLDMSGGEAAGGAGPAGGLHFSAADSAALVHRMANCAADAVAAYAKPDAPARGGALDCAGPVAVSAWQGGRVADVVHVRLALPRGVVLAPLAAAAASGAGWRVLSAAQPDGVAPVSVTLGGADDVALRFARGLGAGGTLYYGYGPGRIAKDGGPGQGAGLYGTDGIPMTTPPNGLPIRQVP